MACQEHHNFPDRAPALCGRRADRGAECAWRRGAAGDNWTYPPYGGQVDGGYYPGRATAVSRRFRHRRVCRARALEALGIPLKGQLELHFTRDREFGGLLGPGWLLEQQLTKPDFVIAAGFSYGIVTAHNACLQLEITVHSKSGHGAMPETGYDALQAANKILNAIYGQLPELKRSSRKWPASTRPPAWWGASTAARTPMWCRAKSS